MLGGILFRSEDGLACIMCPRDGYLRKLDQIANVLSIYNLMSAEILTMFTVCPCCVLNIWLQTCGHGFES